MGQVRIPEFVAGGLRKPAPTGDDQTIIFPNTTTSGMRLNLPPGFPQHRHTDGRDVLVEGNIAHLPRNSGFSDDRCRPKCWPDHQTGILSPIREGHHHGQWCQVCFREDH